MHKSLPVSRLSLLCLLIAPVPLQAEPLPCPDGWLSVRSRINHLTPANAQLSVYRAGSQTTQPATVGSVLCEGDSLLFAPGSEAAQVELFEAGTLLIWDAHRGPYNVPAGAKASLGAAAAYLNALFEGASDMGPTLQRADPTHGRGTEEVVAVGLRAIMPLYGLPRQALVAGTEPVLAWHNGVGPWRCNWLTFDGELLLRGEAVDTVQCTVPPTPNAAAALEVLDARGTSLIWLIDLVPQTRLPRPDWVSTGTPILDLEQRAAWAIWLWREGGPAWRLQALAMLNETRQNWLAGWLLAGILAETPQVAAK